MFRLILLKLVWRNSFWLIKMVNRCLFCNSIEKIKNGKVNTDVVGESRICGSCSTELADIIVEKVLFRLKKSKRSVDRLEDDFDE